MTTPVRPTAIERLSAVVSLLALAAAIVLVVIGAAENLTGLLVTVAGVVVVIGAGWYAVSRRGGTRTIALFAAAGGAVLLVGGFLIGDLSAARIAATVLAAAMSVAAARVALRRSEKAMLEAAHAQTPVPPGRHPVLLINPKSGGGKAEKNNLVDECRERGVEPIVLGPEDDLVELAEEAVARGADVIGMAGGDGSQALVASVATRHDVPHVVVPAGTRNHFALDLGIDRNDVVGALDAYVDGVEHVIDLATVNGRVFVNNASLGLYAKIVQSEEYRDAKTKTTLDMLPDLIGPESDSLDLRFTGPDGTEYPTAPIILVSNNPYELHTLGALGTREHLDLGVLGIVAVQIEDAKAATVLVGLQAAGQAHRFEGWQEWTAPEFRIDSSGPVEIGLDGEALKLDPPLVFEMKPQALRVRIPRHALGRSPAATAVNLLSQSTVAALGRVVAGRCA